METDHRNHRTPARMPQAIPVLTLGLAALAALAFLCPPLAKILEFDRDGLARGEIWRPITGHLAHWTGEHFFWDVLTFVALGSICEMRYRNSYRRCLLASALLVPAAVWLFLPEITVYRGLSGIDSALFTLFVLHLCGEARRARRWIRWSAFASLLGLLLGKTAFELITSTTIFVAAGNHFVPVPLAHIVGAGTALALHAVSRDGSPGQRMTSRTTLLARHPPRSRA